jgi:N-acetylmuramic acid 6-phosphate etherase
MNDRSHLMTELRLPESMKLDAMSIEEAVGVMNDQDVKAIAAVRAESANVAKAIKLVSDALRAGGRLIYFGAGTSGRLGVLDASECPPTFRTNPEQIQGIIAGGEDAMFRAKEGAEDSAETGAKNVDEKNAGPNDVIMGIASGGTTPFVHGALKRAIERGAKTIFLSCVQEVPNEPRADVVIRLLTGPEVLTGSTRLKAGTATKLVLNQITTLAMVQLGKVYENLMVDLRATNTKLVDRATRMIATLTGAPRAEAAEFLKKADGHVKVAVVMYHKKVDAAGALRLIEGARGSLRGALESP